MKATGQLYRFVGGPLHRRMRVIADADIKEGWYFAIIDKQIIDNAEDWVWYWEECTEAYKRVLVRTDGTWHYEMHYDPNA